MFEKITILILYHALAFRQTGPGCPSHSCRGGMEPLLLRSTMLLPIYVKITKALQELAYWPSGQLTSDTDGMILLARAEMCNRIGAAKCNSQSKDNWLDGYRKRLFPAG